MFQEYCIWWIEQFRDLAAPLLHRVRKTPPDALILDRDGAGVWRLMRRRRGIATGIATIPPNADSAGWRRAFAARRRREPVVIALGQSFLQRETIFPFAAASHLDRLVRYEMDRLTPFAAAEYSACPFGVLSVL